MSSYTHKKHVLVDFFRKGWSLSLRNKAMAAVHPRGPWREPVHPVWALGQVAGRARGGGQERVLGDPPELCAAPDRPGGLQGQAEQGAPSLPSIHWEPICVQHFPLKLAPSHFRDCARAFGVLQGETSLRRNYGIFSLLARIVPVPNSNENAVGARRCHGGRPNT